MPNIKAIVALILEKAMAAHSSTLAWKIPWMEEPGGLQSMRSLSGSEGKASACDAGDPGSIPGSGRSPGEGNGNPALLPGKSYGWRSLIGYRPWGRQESDTTERLHFHFHCSSIAPSLNSQVPQLSAGSRAFPPQSFVRTGSGR